MWAGGGGGVREGSGRWVLGWGLGVGAIIDVGGQFRFARNLVRNFFTSRTFNSFFEGYVNSRNLHTPECECSIQKRCHPITQTPTCYVWTVTPCS